MTSPEHLTAVGISGSPSVQSKSRRLLREALDRLEAYGVRTTLIDLSVLPADALLGRNQSSDLDLALSRTAGASIVLASTPVYRATYSGLLKVFFDLLNHRSLAGKLGIAIATGAAPEHQLVIDRGLAPLFASVGAVVVPTSVYGTDEQFADHVPQASLIERIDRAVSEAVTLAERSQSPARSRTTLQQEGVAHV